LQICQKTNQQPVVAMATIWAVWVEWAVSKPEKKAALVAAFFIPFAKFSINTFYYSQIPFCSKVSAAITN
jgi:hypothetical protein